MQVPKISLKWIIPILLLFLISSALIGLNLDQPDQEPVNEDIPEDRPEYLISSDQIPEEWKIDLEMTVRDKYFLQITTGGPLSFAIETKEFVSSEEAQQFIQQDQNRMANTGLDLRFFEDNPRVTLFGVDAGFNWEITSPCCVSRGVSFSIDNYYIYIFGSQNSKWDEINLLFTEQARNLFQFVGEDIPAEFQSDSGQSSLPFPLFGLASVFILIGTHRMLKKKV